MKALPTVAEAERLLKDAIAAGASDAEIDAASLAVIDAQHRDAKMIERAAVRQRLAGDVKREESAGRRRAMQKMMNDAERALIEGAAPTVTVQSGPVVVTIRLQGGRDPHRRLVLVEAVRLAVAELDRQFLERIGQVRASAAGDCGVALPDSAFMVARLRDELRHALSACPGAVTIEYVEPINSPIAAANDGADFALPPSWETASPRRDDTFMPTQGD